MTQVKWLVLLTACVTTFSGCATGRTVILHPIEKSDIVSMKKGIPYAPEKDGWFLSDYTLSEVENAKVETIRKSS